VSSLGLGGLDTPSLQGGPDEQRGEELHLGGRVNRGRSVLRGLAVPPGGGCTGAENKLFNPPGHVVGSVAVGFLTDDRGNAVLNNEDVVVPTTVSGSSQGGAEANVVICNHDNLGEAIPAGSVFHYQLIAP
jgi:hypothetical protein